MNLKTWLGQPSTISGIGHLAMTITGALTQLALHQVDIAAVVGLATNAAVNLLMPDNTAAPASAQKLIEDTARAVAQKHVASALEAAMPAITADAIQLLQGLMVAQRVAVPVVAPPSNPQPVAG